jgi:hypothetical protein
MLYFVKKQEVNPKNWLWASLHLLYTITFSSLQVSNYGKSNQKDLSLTQPNKL